MKFPVPSRKSAAAAAVLAMAFCVCAPGQDAKSDAAKSELKGMPPRSGPGDYQAHAQAGNVGIGAEFTGHSIATPDATYTNEEYVAVEVGLFAPANTQLKLSFEDFSLRINGSKKLQSAQEYGAVFHSLKDPLYVAPEEVEAKKNKGSGNGINTGGGSRNDQGNLPPIIHIPIGVERAMQQKVQKAALPEGERPLPVAGLIFFEHRGKVNSAELVYNGPAGKATLKLQ